LGKKGTGKVAVGKVPVAWREKSVQKQEKKKLSSINTRREERRIVDFAHIGDGIRTRKRSLQGSKNRVFHSTKQRRKRGKLTRVLYQWGWQPTDEQQRKQTREEREDRKRLDKE